MGFNLAITEFQTAQELNNLRRHSITIERRIRAKNFLKLIFNFILCFNNFKFNCITITYLLFYTKAEQGEIIRISLKLRSNFLYSLDCCGIYLSVNQS